MRIPFVQIDAFASVPFGGNPAAVMMLEAWLPDATLQAIAAENNLAETAFLVPCADLETADFDLRWFTPAVEVALCGHATLASGHLVLSAIPAMPAVRFSTLRAGVLSVARSGDGYAMALPSWPAAAEPRRRLPSSATCPAGPLPRTHPPNTASADAMSSAL